MSQKDWINSSALYAANAAYFEDHPEALQPELLELAPGERPEAELAALERLWESRQVGALRIINAYRFLGVYQADLDPLARFPREDLPELTPEY